MSDIRAIVLDLDFTLLTRDKTVRPRTLDSLVRAHDKGFQLIIATSRPVRAVRSFVPEALLQRCTLITLNGAVVHEFTRGHQWQMSCMGLTARKLIKRLRDAEPPVQITAECWGEDFATNREYSDEELRKKQHADFSMLKTIEQIDYGWISKVTADGQGQPLNALLEWSGDYPEYSFIPALENTVVNIVPKAIDKSTTVVTVLKRLQIHPSEMLVFADEMPDLRLMEMAGVAVAMGNAVEPLKEAANTVIGDCDSDAIADYLDATLLREQASA
ncbi:MAG: HAD-IIB family hydrolase [Natronospirillum sp.]|uniref:HAD-IIB family hydrolase n=1 Tax=Natronospirillum sp. TaxID=2812955 RepID=UPI0025F83BCD|nr:HAD-IIB family hydrolase [Natronospirillum sp.]MCH8552163.1 HAD-IIB family hydrolase [Natronospirillum sp.]